MFALLQLALLSLGNAEPAINKTVWIPGLATFALVLAAVTLFSAGGQVMGDTNEISSYQATK